VLPIVVLIIIAVLNGDIAVMATRIVVRDVKADRAPIPRAEEGAELQLAPQ